jgi:phosphatidylinositol-3-phosphatase
MPVRWYRWFGGLGLPLAIVAIIFSASTATANGLRTGLPVPRLQHVVVIVFENKDRASVLGSGSAPTFDKLAAQYAQATNDHAISHPSLPNYLALVSGSTHGVSSDCEDCPQTGPTIGSQLTARGANWGSYAEDYPMGSGFAKKHVPFLYFPGGAAHVHPLSAFRPTRLPTFSFVTPSLCHDAHDCPIATADAWLAKFIKPLLSIKRTAIFIVFDEGNSNIGGGGQVALIAAGTAIKPHSQYTASTSHYGLLHTMEDALALPPIGNAAHAAPITGIWR